MVIANYPGADAQTVANTVGIPMEEAINGVENMLYMNSTSSNNGTYVLTVVFETGTDPDKLSSHNLSAFDIYSAVQALRA